MSLIGGAVCISTWIWLNPNGGWRALTPGWHDQPTHHSDSVIDTHQQNHQPAAPLAPAEDQAPEFNRQLAMVADWLGRGHHTTAAQFINDHYSEFSSEQLDQFKSLFLTSSNNEQVDIARFRAAIEVFDDLEAWTALSNAAISAEDWSAGFRALMRASELENRPLALEAKLIQLVEVASHVRAGLERRGDELGIKSLYHDAHSLHPTYPRFQLELAHAHLRLDEVSAAKTLLIGLRYDPDYGEIARQTLARVDQQERATASDTQLSSSQQDNSYNDIVVPMIRSGNSFLVDTTINNGNARLLLDTGASITALSNDLITSLALQPTGQTIQLSTANGTRTARLFRTNSVQFGRVRLNGLVVAGIDLGGAPGFDGLLGTDALNGFGGDYNYVIDNDRSSLIFRR